jgi:hypothetical protein
MPADNGKNLLAQNGKQIGLAGRATLVRKQDLQALARYWR